MLPFILNSLVKEMENIISSYYSIQLQSLWRKIVCQNAFQSGLSRTTNRVDQQQDWLMKVFVNNPLINYLMHGILRKDSCSSSRYICN